MLKYLTGSGTCVKAVTVGERISVQIRHLVKKGGYTVPIDKVVIFKKGKLVSRFLCPCLALEAEAVWVTLVLPGSNLGSYWGNGTTGCS
jgi:hypothetical protein